jgi:predicted nucleic acid-binding protein
MRRVTVDSSLAAKWFLHEAGTVEAQTLLDEWSGAAEVWAPDLIWVECANATRHKVAAGELTSAFGLRLLRAFLNVEIRAVPCRDVAEEAVRTAVQTGLTTWDACYVATARALGAELWTADGEMHSRGLQAYPNIHLLTWPRQDAGEGES